MSPLLFLLLAAAAGFGLYRTLRSRAENIRYLEQAGEDAPLMISHLSSALQRLARDTRALRLSLEDPLRQLRALPGRMSPDFDAHAIDQLLMNTSREVGDWVNEVSRLSEADIEHLLDVGANTAAIRDVFGAAGYGFELGSGGTKQARAILGQLEELQRELLRIERALQIQSDPYR